MENIFLVMNKFKIIIFGILICFSILIPFINPEYMIWVIFFLSFNLILFFYLAKIFDDKKEFRFVFMLCFAGLSIRMLIIIITQIIPRFAVPSDDLGYITNANKIIDLLSTGSFKISNGLGNSFYELYNAVIYIFFGFNPSFVKIINCFFGILTAINVYIISQKLIGNKTAKIAMFFTMFFPSLLFWQTMNLKEAIVVFLITSIIKNMLYLKENTSFITLVISFIYVYFLFLARSYAGALMGGLLFLYFFIISKYSKVIKAATLFFVVLIGCVVVFKTNAGHNLLNYLKLASNLGWIDYNVRRYDYSLSPSAVLQDVSYSNIPQLLKFMPLGLSYFLFAPFPWMIGGTSILFFSGLENIVLYPLFLFLIIGLVISFKKDKLISLFLFAILFVFTLFYSATMGNLGLAYRYKDMLMPVAFIFISAGIAELDIRLRKKSAEGPKA